MPSFLAFAVSESRNNLKIFPTSLTYNYLRRGICYSFLIMVLISIISIVTDNNINCDINSLMPMSLLLISNKKLPWCNRLTTNNNFWCHQELKMWISGALFEQRIRFNFEQKVNRFIKMRIWGQSSNHNFRIHDIWTRKTDFFHDSRKSKFKFTR